MPSINAHTVLIVATILMVLGLIGVLTRKNVIFMLLSVEIMLNAAGLAFIAAGAQWNQPDGQVMFLFILAMAAAEVSVGLALVLQIHHQHKTLDVENLRDLSDVNAETSPGEPKRHQ
jgi:NADH-quinone oxidoreductase subunit K